LAKSEILLKNRDMYRIFTHYYQIIGNLFDFIKDQEF